MILLPAVDIRGGQCVRLTKGDFNKETVFASDPSEMAERWAATGATYLHVVDLDGALYGSSRNLESIGKILSKVTMTVEVGGGIRTISDIEKLLDMGVSRVILGSVAVRKPELVREACKKFPGHIIVGIDAKKGVVAVEGWGVSGEIKDVELAKQMAAVGVERIIFTDISKDGMLSGVNVEATAALAAASGIKVIASGGVASVEDIKILKRYEQKGIEGCIIGKAIYTGAVDLRQALKIARN